MEYATFDEAASTKKGNKGVCGHIKVGVPQIHSQHVHRPVTALQGPMAPVPADACAVDTTASALPQLGAIPARIPIAQKPSSECLKVHTTTHQQLSTRVIQLI